MAAPIQDVQRKPTNGISVLVAGAGIGGLMTALECWRQGCDVRILERTKTTITTGDSFSIGHTATSYFRYWPQMQKENREIAYRPMMAYHTPTGERIKGPLPFHSILSKKTSNGGEYIEVFRHSRPKFHAMLLRQLNRIGIQVEYDCPVAEYFEDAETDRADVVLKNGRRIEADLVVAADGGRSSSWSLIAGHPVPARSSGSAIFRAAYDVNLALADPMIAERFPLLEDGSSVVELWVGHGTLSPVFWRNKDEMTWAIMHPDDGSAEESWGKPVLPADVLKWTAQIADWPEVANRVINCTPPANLIDWKLMFRDPQPTWTSPKTSRVVQLGDAAHMFLPSSGNGGTQAIEDAVSLAACIHCAGRKANIPHATRIHNLLRFERVSCLQALGVANQAKMKTKTAPSRPQPQHENGKVNGDDTVDKKGLKLHLGKWIIEHEPEQYAYDNYAAAARHLSQGSEFKNTNTPPGMVYRPWTIDTLLEAQARGEPTVLDGDWE
ncbi:FAD-dependent monooxygenase mdpD [Acrodontium crateriforme]|uniref:FAD-dependent monooxygenase mdpD n=1 Tax=Acrodontium crateriforme TaxID=150365 RepID=A0AAQ3MBN0_9PEZI|nr:FAD-dependent monooxygenase mdpD [Acrodontium crateriforme]